MWKIGRERLNSSEAVDAKPWLPLPDVDCSPLNLGRDLGPGFHGLACDNAEGPQ